MASMSHHSCTACTRKRTARTWYSAYPMWWNTRDECTRWHTCARCQRISSKTFQVLSSWCICRTWCILRTHFGKANTAVIGWLDRKSGMCPSGRHPHIQCMWALPISISADFRVGSSENSNNHHSAAKFWSISPKINSETSQRKKNPFRKIPVGRVQKFVKKIVETSKSKLCQKLTTKNLVPWHLIHLFVLSHNSQYSKVLKLSQSSHFPEFPSLTPRCVFGHSDRHSLLYLNLFAMQPWQMLISASHLAQCSTRHFSHSRWGICWMLFEGSAQLVA